MVITPPPSVDLPAPEVIAPIDEVVAPVRSLFYYYDAFLTAIEPKTYKDDLTRSCWIEAMQEELNEFKRLEVWELVPRPDKVMVITLKWIYKVVKLDELGGHPDFLKSRRFFINQSKYALESLQKYGFELVTQSDTPMSEEITG
ncbi:retrovirus-related pol polyprotein from transposon TNT 1-94 [Tanacetum coccineum]